MNCPAVVQITSLNMPGPWNAMFVFLPFLLSYWVPALEAFIFDSQQPNITMILGTCVDVPDRIIKRGSP